MTTPPLDLQGTTSVVFRLDDHQSPEARFSVTDPQEVRRIVSLVQFKPWGNCVPGCEHVLSVSFRTGSSSVDVDFCQICFGSYQMPEAFYQEFRKLARGHGWRELDPILWTAKHD